MANDLGLERNTPVDGGRLGQSIVVTPLGPAGRHGRMRVRHNPPIKSRGNQRCCRRRNPVEVRPLSYLEASGSGGLKLRSVAVGSFPSSLRVSTRLRLSVAQSCRSESFGNSF